MNLFNAENRYYNLINAGTTQFDEPARAAKSKVIH